MGIYHLIIGYNIRVKRALVKFLTKITNHISYLFLMFSSYNICSLSLTRFPIIKLIIFLFAKKQMHQKNTTILMQLFLMILAVSLVMCDDGVNIINGREYQGQYHASQPGVPSCLPRTLLTTCRVGRVR